MCHGNVITSYYSCFWWAPTDLINAPNWLLHYTHREGLEFGRASTSETFTRVFDDPYGLTCNQERRDIIDNVLHFSGKFKLCSECSRNKLTRPMTFLQLQEKGILLWPRLLRISTDPNYAMFKLATSIMVHNRPLIAYYPRHSIPEITISNQSSKRRQIVGFFIAIRKFFGHW